MSGILDELFDKLPERAKMPVLVLGVVLGLGVPFYFIFIHPSAVDRLATGDCIQLSSDDWEEVPCDSPDARWQIGSPCNVYLELQASFEKDTFCAHGVAD